MQVRVLGPIEVHSAEGRVGVPSGGKERLLLAALLLNAPRTVSCDRLIDMLWGERLPEDPAAALRNHVSRLRTFLEDLAADEVLRSEPSGYRLVVDPDQIDAGRFEAIHKRVEGLSEPEQQLTLLDEALGLWRGEPWEDLQDLPHALGEVARLRELLAGVTERRVECLLRMGRTGEALAAAESLVHAEPLRERPRALRMQGLYMAGRHSEALSVFQEYRRVLSDELGLDPSPALRGLEGAILRHEPLSMEMFPAPPALPSGPLSAAPPSDPAPAFPPSDPASASPPSHPAPAFPPSKPDREGTESAAVPPAPSPPRLQQVIRFCRAPDGVRLAYATVGKGPPLVKAANWLNHLEFDWESPVWRRHFRELAAERTLVRYDERGSGLSDRDPPRMSLDAWVMDLETVVDASGLERFPLLGISQGCAVCIEYAARHPERVSALVLHGGYAAGWRATDGYPEAEVARREASIDIVRHGWGEDTPAYRQMFTLTFIPGGTQEEIDWFNELERRTVSPEGAARFMEAFAALDVRHRLAEVRAPTLVLHSRQDQRIHHDQGRELAMGIPGARFVLLESANHLVLEHEPAFDHWIREVQGFLAEEADATGTR